MSSGLVVPITLPPPRWPRSTSACSAFCARTGWCAGSALDGNTGQTLLDVLNAARTPYEQALAYRRQRREAEEEKRRHLCEEPVAMREHLRHNEHALGSYFQALGEPGVHALKLMLTSNTAPLPNERGVLRAIARDLGETLAEPEPQAVDPPGAEVTGEVAPLIEDYRATQTKQVRALAASHGEGPSLHRAWDLLHQGGPLDPTALDRLPQDAEHDAAGRREQHERRDVYLDWREQAARQLARKAGPLGRLTHRPEDSYPQLDREHLKVCAGCEETIYPRARKASSPPPPSCHYCRKPHGIKTYDPTSTASMESEASQ